MIRKELILILPYFFYSCQQKFDRQQNKQIQATKIVEKDSIQIIDDVIAMIDVKAMQKKTTEYGGGDVYGWKVFCFNQDSTLLKVLNESSSGDYGFVKERFYVKDGKLIYTERLTAEIEFGKEDVKSNYHIIREKNYFPAAGKSFKLIQQKIAQQQYDTLLDKVESRKIALTMEDYEKEMAMLKQIESYQFSDEN